MGHQHHHHNCHHHHTHTHQRMSFAFWLNLIFAIIELIGGFYVNSMSIMSDALHDFGDAFSIGIAWLLEKKSLKQTDQRYSYGYRRYSTISAVLTSIVLIVGSSLILIESLPRLLNPVQPETNGMILLAILGVLVNGAAFIRMKGGSSLNEKVLTWHFVEDLLGWGLILVSAVIMKLITIPALDSVVAIFISLFVIRNVWKNLHQAMQVFLQATPTDLDLEEIKKNLKEKFQLEDIHHMHLWSLDGEKHIFTAHLVLSKQFLHQELPGLKHKIKNELIQKYKIHEATLEFEDQGEACLDPSHVTD